MDEFDKPVGPNSGIVSRAKAILTAPKAEWPVIAGETESVQGVFTRYVVPLAAIGPVCAFIGMQLFGFHFLFVSYRPSLMVGLTSAIVEYVLRGLLMVFVIAWVASFLADKFGGQQNFPRAFRLCAYSLTALWVAGVLYLLPSLGILVLLAGLYGIYLFYLGITPMMGVPQDKAAGYTAVTILGVILLYFVIGQVTASVSTAFGPSAIGLSSSADSATVTIPGVGSVDTAKLDEANRNVQAAVNGQAKPVDPAKLQALLPSAIGSYQRTALASNAIGQIGGDVEGTYTAGDKSFSLKIVDSTGLGAVAGLAGAMGVQSSHEDANGYERTSSVNGQLQSEKWDKASSNGTVTQQVASRFMITADGSAASVDDLKAAVNSIDQGRLAGLAN